MKRKEMKCAKSPSRLSRAALCSPPTTVHELRHTECATRSAQKAPNIRDITPQIRLATTLILPELTKCCPKCLLERQLDVTPPSSSSSGLSRFWANTNVELLYRETKAHKDEIRGQQIGNISKDLKLLPSVKPVFAGIALDHELGYVVR